jgi:hypothetical protein
VSPAVTVAALGALTLAASALVVAHAPTGPGVVVTEVTPHSPGSEAGLEPGDLITGWARPEPTATGGAGPTVAVATLLDWLQLVDQERPRGSLRLRWTAEGGERSALLPAAPWGLHVRPRFENLLLTAWERGRSALTGAPTAPEPERVTYAVELWRAAALLARAEGDWPGAWFLFREGGSAAVEAGLDDLAQAAFADAARVAAEEGHAVAEVAGWNAAGMALL